jgi:hypothetical protein
VGLILSELGYFNLAALQLHRVITDTSASLSREKTTIFSDAYKEARRKVCRVEVAIDQVGASVEIDRIKSGKGRADFWLFLMPGDHVIRARLPKFQDTIAGFVAEAGGQLNVALVMQPVPIKSPRPVVTATAASEIMTNDHNEPPPVRPPSPPLPGDKPATNPLKTSSERQFVLGTGVWIPFGATPGVALGVQLQGGFRSLPRTDWWWELGVGARAALAPGYVPFGARFVYTWTALFAPCARYREHVFGCVLVAANGGGLALFNSRAFPGVGVRAGYEFHPSNRFSVAVFGDLELRFGSPKLNPGTDKDDGNRAVPAYVANTLIFF